MGATLFAFCFFSYLQDVGTREASHGIAARRRLKIANGTNALANLQEGCHEMESWEREAKGVVYYGAILLYAFFGLAIVCDDFFVASLEQISERLKLSEDVAGATFMAAGSSAPELFVSIADNVLTKPGKVIGMGTIIGSAIFNICVIIAVTSMLAGRPLQLDYRPLSRDSAWYALSILILLIVVWDKQVTLFESVVLFVGYIGYLVQMIYNEAFMEFMERRFGKPAGADETQSINSGADEKATQPPEAPIALALVTAGGARHNSVSSESGHPTRKRSVSHAHRKSSSSDPKLLPEHGTSSSTQPLAGQVGTVQVTIAANPLADKGQDPSAQLNRAAADKAAMQTISLDESAGQEMASQQNQVSEDEENGYWESVIDVPSDFLGKLWFFLTFPLSLAFKLSIPDCRYAYWQTAAGCSLTFVMSIVWIGFLTFAVVYCIEKIGCGLDAPFSLLALTVVAAGTSVPDALSSVLVARDGQGDMAVSNAIGSNIFDILLGLGAPFILSNLIYDAPVQVGSPEEDFGELLISVFILFGVLLAVILILKHAKWILHKRVGFTLFAIYVCYVIFAYTYETAK